MTPTETIVLQTERFINSPEFKKHFPNAGEDVKVMGLRKNGDLHLTIGVAFIDKYVENEDAYFRMKAEMSEEIYKFVKERTNFKNVNIQLNTLDIKGRGVNGVYLTVLGTSAESGDSGQVGRGNRVNGVFPLNRPICSEAAAGKNPVSHVGKIYNLLTHHIANQVYNQVEGIREIYVWLLSKIGEPIDQPVIASAHVIMKEGIVFNDASHEINRVIDYELEHIDRFCEALAYGRLQLY
jgi:S-adenosylmethionine synthetase